MVLVTARPRPSPLWTLPLAPCPLPRSPTTTDENFMTVPTTRRWKLTSCQRSLSFCLSRIFQRRDQHIAGRWDAGTRVGKVGKVGRGRRDDDAREGGWAPCTGASLWGRRGRVERGTRPAGECRERQRCYRRVAIDVTWSKRVSEGRGRDLLTSLGYARASCKHASPASEEQREREYGARGWRGSDEATLIENEKEGELKERRRRRERKKTH